TQARWDGRLSTLSPISFTSRFSNSSFFRAQAINSVEQTGVKSAGWEKRTTHCPSKSDRLISPWVVLAVNCGAGSPILGRVGVCASTCSMVEDLLIVFLTSHK